MHRLTIFIAALTLFACGGSDDPTPPTCQSGQLKITGTVDQTQVVQTLSPNGGYFQNGGIDTGSGPQDGKYIAELTQNGSQVPVVQLTFKKLVADGQSADALGFVDLSSVGGPNVGNCETGDLVSTISIDADGNGGTFVIRDLHDSPYCSGASRSGALAGCWRD